MKYLPLALILTGCASGSIVDKAMMCEPHESKECVEMRARADAYLDRKRQRRYCPSTMVEIKQGEWVSCVMPQDLWSQF